MSSGTVVSLPPIDADVESQPLRRAEVLAWALVGLGVAVRFARYLLRFPLWGDEVMLADNFLDRGYAELTEGLSHTQVAPIGYLWFTRLLVDLFGFNEFSLRGAAILSGIGGVILFRIAAGHVLRGWSLVAAVGLLATAYYPIRHAAEVKPYAGDLLAAVILLEPLLAWIGRPDRVGSLWRLIPAAIVALPLSFPAAFVAGGVSLTILFESLRRRNLAVLRPWLAFNLAILAAFTAVYFLALQNQFATNGAKMQWHWEAGFPPSLAQPIAWFTWVLQAHSGEALAYPLGGDNGGSTGQLLLAIVGGTACWQSGRRGLVTVAAATLGLSFAATLLGRYPYGYGERLQQFWGPFVCLLVGEGISVALRAVRHLPTQRRLAVGLTTAAFSLGVGLLLHDLVRPYKSRLDEENREFSRWFWRYAGEGEPLVDLHDDLGVAFFEPFQAMIYRTNKQLTGLRADPRATRQPLPTGRSLRCVAYNRVGSTRDDDRYAAWLAAMQRDYRLVDERRYPSEIDTPGQVGEYFVWRFEPKSETATLPDFGTRR